MLLRRYVMWHTAGWATAILLAGASVILVQTHGALERDSAALIGTLERLLEVQMVGIVADRTFRADFPDWQVVTRASNERVECIRLRHPDGALWRSACRGESDAHNEAPPMFARLYRRVFQPGGRLVRNINDAHGLVARLELQSSIASEVSVAWQASKRLGGVAVATVVLLSLVVFGIVTRALSQTASIRAGLARLHSGDLDVRLAPGRFDEIAHLAQAVNQLAEGLAASDATRLKLGNQLVNLQEEERQHLARELHDEFGQHLTGIAGLAASIRYSAPLDHESNVVAAGRIEAVVQALQSQVRNLLAALRPPGLMESGLAASLDSLILQWNYQSRGQLVARLDLHGEFADLAMPLAVTIYRIVQESLTNAARHAQAKEVRVQLARRVSVPADMLRAVEIIELCVTDDGVPLSAGTTTGTGLGRRGIEERVAALQGQVEFGTVNDGPGRVRVLLPIVDTGTGA